MNDANLGWDSAAVLKDQFMSTTLGKIWNSDRKKAWPILLPYSMVHMFRCARISLMPNLSYLVMSIGANQ